MSTYNSQLYVFTESNNYIFIIFDTSVIFLKFKIGKNLYFSCSWLFNFDTFWFLKKIGPSMTIWDNFLVKNPGKSSKNVVKFRDREQGTNKTKFRFIFHKYLTTTWPANLNFYIIFNLDLFCIKKKEKRKKNLYLICKW